MNVPNAPYDPCSRCVSPKHCAESMGCALILEDCAPSEKRDTTISPLERVALACLDDFRDGWGGDIDGCTFEEYLHKHGVTDRQTVTPELREQCGSSNCCCEDGDSCNRIKPEVMAKLKQFCKEKA